MGKLVIKNRFATVPNDLVNSKDISLKAKGLFAYIQSKPDGWDFSAERIAHQSKEGLPAIMAALKELENFGYLTRERYMSEIGHRLVQYTLFDVPTLQNANEEKVHRGFTHEGNAYVVKPSNNIKKENTNKESIKTIIEIKVNEFRNLIESSAFLLGDQYESFIDYWAEPNQKNGKLRWEDQKFFNIERRITTWMNNNKKYNNNGSETKLGTSAARMAALAKF